MILTSAQIEEVLRILDRYSATFIGHNIGPSVLSKYERSILTKAGISINQMNSSVVGRAFSFGMLSNTLSDSAVKMMSYNQLKQYIKDGKMIPLNAYEKQALESLKRQTYNGVTKQFSKIKSQVSDKLVYADKKTNTVLHSKKITDKAKEAVEKRKSVQWLKSEIGHLTGEWTRDLDRISDYVLHTAFDEGRAAVIEREGPTRLVYKNPYPMACFPIKDTEYLTSDGFKYLDDIDGSERVLSYNIETNTAEWVGILEKVRYEYEGEMHHYKNSTLDLLSTPNHKHLVGRHYKKNKKSYYKNELISSKDLISGKISEDDVFYKSVENWNGNNNKKIIVEGKNFKSEHFAKFMGWYLSEGHCSMRRSKKNYKDGSLMSQIVITQTKSHNLNEIKSVLKNTFPDRNVIRTKSSFVVNMDKSYDGFVKWLKKIGVCYEKYVPREILDMSKTNLGHFINAYISGDGHRRPYVFGKRGGVIDGQISITTTSKKILDGLSEVIIKLGHGVGYSERDMNGINSYKKNGSKITSRRIRYDLRINKWKRSKYIKRYFKKIDNWKGVVGCLSLDKNNTLMIRRNKKYIWSGNCKHCVSAYLTAGIGSEPKVFYISELRENATNVGRKTADWKPVIGPVHPYCRCTLIKAPINMTLIDLRAGKWEWDGSKFKNVELNKKKVERPKVKVTVNGNTRYV